MIFWWPLGTHLLGASPSYTTFALENHLVIAIVTFVYPKFTNSPVGNYPLNNRPLDTNPIIYRMQETANLTPLSYTLPFGTQLGTNALVALISSHSLT